jgi:phosphate transport system permease protein
MNDIIARRTRQTKPSVIWIDRITRVVITLGGVGTIAAVIAVAVFLFAVALPLFLPPKLSLASRQQLPVDEPWRLIATDTEKSIGLGVTSSGRWIAWSHRQGKIIADKSLELAAPITALSQSVGNEDFFLGLANGSIQRGQIKFEESFPPETEIQNSSEIKIGEERIEATGIVTRTRAGQLRRTKINLSLDPPIATGESTPVTSIDHLPRKPGTLVATLHQSLAVLLHEVITKPERSTKSFPLPKGDAQPRLVRIFGKGNRLLRIHSDCSIDRFDIKSLSEPKLVEQQGGDDTDRIKSADWIVGRETLLCTSEQGRLFAGFLARPDELNQSPPDGLTWIESKVLAGAGDSIGTLATSSKLRLVAVAKENQSVELYQVTTGQKIASLVLEDPSPVSRLSFSPSDDALLIGQQGSSSLASVDLRHPEATPASLFRPVWYESYDRAAHVWQSDSAGGAEPKFGMMPLIFGSLKATIYSMLFGAPLALLAAIYTSEFLSKSNRARIKPTIELMAGLPSVVLGFIAAMVLAPLVGQHLTAVLLSFITIPLTFLLLGHLWQILPQRMTLRLTTIRFLLIILALPLGAFLAAALAPTVEQRFFSNDLKLWLDGQVGSAVPGWIFILLPISALLTGWLVVTQVDPVLRPRLNAMSRFTAAIVILVRFLMGLAMALGLAAVGGAVLSAFGWDPRGSVVDTYIQRNSLVVGFVMGFAIIPIIYTLADDALSTVPENLRSASLGAGATPWQTAILIVVPSAMSGLFSAVMVGLGRAVGETMIVLMAAGSSPILDWNIFNGFRTLSANIAIELPEAVQGSTHYRILFFAAVVLFLLTSVLNTVAEIVRMRFRKRAVQL